MTPELWQRVKRLFDQVVELDSAARAACIEREAGADRELRTAVEDLLAHHSEGSGWLEQMPVREIDPTGSAIGPYQLIRRLGQGGMGTVWLAERVAGGFRQRVALKVVSLGSRSPEILARLRTERQILADLEHPNLAHLLDGGATPAGEPYLVMEHIEGLPLDEHCERRGLAVRERLDLFLDLTSAVAYAHRNLVVHRDLKPDNVLVSAAGQVKLLDFGIAKLLDLERSTDAGQTVGHLMTPEYASPEQLSGQAISTATDIWSLGAILHRLLTGRVPFAVAGRPLAEVVHLICESELPTVMNRGGPHLDGDLEAILRKALRKEPDERYRTVEQLADDLRRHLARRPVLARQGSAIYRTTRFVRRNRLGLAAGAALVGVIAVGLGSTIAAKGRAERRFGELRKLANAVLFDYQESLAALDGATEVRARMLRDSLVYLDGLAAEAGADRELMLELALAYERVGDIQGNSAHHNLGQLKDAEESYRRSMELRQRLADLEPDNPEYQRQLSLAHGNQGDILVDQGDPKAAYAAFARGLAIIAPVAARESAPQYRRQHSRKLLELGLVLGHPAFANLGDTAQAIDHLRRAVEIVEQLYAEDPGDSLRRFNVIPQRRFYADLLRAAGRRDEALASYERARDLAAAWLRDEPDNAQARENWVHQQSKIALIRLEQGATGEATLTLRETARNYRQVAAEDPRDAQRQRSLMVELGRLAEALVSNHDPEPAVAAAGEAAALASALHDADPSGLTLADLVEERTVLAYSLAASGEPARASAEYGTSASAAASLRRGSPGDLRAIELTAEVHRQRALVLLQLGELEQAAIDIEAGVDLYTSLRAQSPLRADYHRHLALLEASRAEWRCATGDRVGAEASWRISEGLWDGLERLAPLAPAEVEHRDRSRTALGSRTAGCAAQRSRM